ncbi:MAG: hypothetical protein ABR558_10500 [Thioalkalivibrio sp.]
MNISHDKDSVTLTIDAKTADKLLDELKAHTGDLDATNGARALASVLQQAIYQINDDFRQPPHAFDEQAAKQPPIEE